MSRTDYLGRPVCYSCGHTAALHGGAVCGAANCVCRVYAAEEPEPELPPLTDDEVRAELDGVIA